MRLAVFGATGRLGLEIVRAAHREGLRVTVAVASPKSPALGRDIGELAGLGASGVLVSSDGDLAQADAAIDFSSPAGTMRALVGCTAQKLPLVIGTTGFSAETSATIDAAAATIPLVQSFNMSLGVNLLARLVELASRALGEGFDIEIVEAHHRKKRDAPSGTALLLGEAAARGRGLSLQSARRDGRSGMVGERGPSEIGLHAVRGGSVVGDHQVLLLGEGERLTLGHQAESRSVFAAGAVRAARWLLGRPPGRYTMADVLGV